MVDINIDVDIVELVMGDMSPNETRGNGHEAVAAAATANELFDETVRELTGIRGIESMCLKWSDTWFWELAPFFPAPQRLPSPEQSPEPMALGPEHADNLGEETLNRWASQWLHYVVAAHALTCIAALLMDFRRNHMAFNFHNPNLAWYATLSYSFFWILLMTARFVPTYATHLVTAIAVVSALSLVFGNTLTFVMLSGWVFSADFLFSGICAAINFLYAALLVLNFCLMCVFHRYNSLFDEFIDDLFA